MLSFPSRPRSLRTPGWCWLFVTIALPLSGGCSSFLLGKSDAKEEEARLRELLTVPKVPELIRDAAVPYGLQPLRIEGVAAVNGLPGTGGPSDPSPLRDQLLDEMKRESIRDPNLFLETDQTSVVKVEALIPPGARKGDPIDLRVTAPPQSRTRDLHGGWMMNTRLRQQQRIANSVRRSDVKALGIGPVLTRADYDPREDETHKLQGLILAGGRVQEERKLGLLLRPQYQHAKMSADLAAAINRRFFFFDGTTRRGIATAIEDDFIELEVHPRYRGAEHRMMAVVRSISGNLQDTQTQSRLANLAQELSDPTTSANAALQLEAMGESAIPTLLDGIKSDNPELRFYAAEVLAYLDRSEAVEPLEVAARDIPAFRHPALSALQGLDHQLAIDALQRLMNEESLETRYGAFCAIRGRPQGRGVLPSNKIGDSFRLYRVASTARPAVVVSLRETPEVVIFGTPSAIQIKNFLLGPAGLTVRPEPASPGQLRISRFVPGKEDRRTLADSTVTALIEGIGDVGGDYGDVIATLRLAKADGQMVDQLAIDPLPESQRTYHRETESDPDDDQLSPAELTSADERANSESNDSRFKFF